MRGTVAKQIRKDVYENPEIPKSRYKVQLDGSIKFTGKRREYQDAKKNHLKLSQVAKKAARSRRARRESVAV